MSWHSLWRLVSCKGKQERKCGCGSAYPYPSPFFEQEAPTFSLLGELLVVKNRMPPSLRGMQAGVWGCDTCGTSWASWAGWLFVDGGRGLPSQSPQAATPWFGSGQVRETELGQNFGLQATPASAQQVFDLKRRTGKPWKPKTSVVSAVATAATALDAPRQTTEPGLVSCASRVGSLVLGGRRGNCGPKFPHLSGANYLWLTPPGSWR